MVESMRCLQIVAPGQVVWTERPVPAPGAGEVLVKVAMVNTCPHWDLHLVDGVPMFPGAALQYPYTPGQPGHEAAGEVVAVGAGVGDLAIGARVACWRDAGHHRPGCYAQYVVMARENVLPLPEGVSWEQASSLELAMCVQVSIEQLRRNHCLAGRRLAIGGLGPAGLVAVQLARAQGAAGVVGLDPLAARRELAQALGAELALEPTPAAWDERVGGAVDAAIDCTGLKASIEFLLERTRRAVCIFGVLRETIEYRAAYWGGRSLLGYEPHNLAAAQEALALIAAGRLDLACLVSARLPFHRYLEGIDLLRRKEAIKIGFLPWAE